MFDDGSRPIPSSVLLGQSVWNRCQQLASCTDFPGQITRLFLGQGMQNAHALIKPWMQQAGLDCHVDAIGNLIGRRRAVKNDAPVLLIGSHLDTVPNGGKYDGALGVLLAMACMEQIGAEPLPFNIDVIGFSEEEGVRFRLPYLGSHAVAGRFDATWLDRKDSQNISMRDAIRSFGLNPDDIHQCACKTGKILGYIEAHIEQGPVLDAAQLPVGLVSAIAGQSRMRLTFTGRAAHAGTTPMELRADALVAAARVIVAAQEIGRKTEGLRVTVGQINNTPNASNVIPACTQISLDVRHAINAVRERAVVELLATAQNTATAQSVILDVQQDSEQSAVACDEHLITHLHAAIASMGLHVQSLVSGAGHDAVAVSALTGVGMLFVRHPGGVSHHPDETVNAADVGIAVEVLTRFIRQLAQSLQS